MPKEMAPLCDTAITAPQFFIFLSMYQIDAVILDSKPDTIGAKQESVESGTAFPKMSSLVLPYFT